MNLNLFKKADLPKLEVSNAVVPLQKTATQPQRPAEPPALAQPYQPDITHRELAEGLNTIYGDMMAQQKVLVDQYTRLEDLMAQVKDSLEGVKRINITIKGDVKEKA